MKKISWILILCMLTALLAGCGTTSSSGTSSNDKPEIEVPNFADAIIQHTVFKADEGESYREYQIVYYTGETHKLTKLVVEVQFDKDYGYTEEYLNEADLDETYPNFSTFSFASRQVIDDGDYYTLVVTFDELDNMDNIDRLEESGIIQTDDSPDSTFMDADSYMDLLRGQGYPEVEITDDAYLTLHF